MRKTGTSKTTPREPRKRPQATPLTVRPLTSVTKRSIRGIAKDLVGQHSTEIATRIRDGLLADNLKTSLKYLVFCRDTSEGKPVETHRMVGLNDGPSGAYDLSKLSPQKQKQLLALLRDAKDTTTPKGEA